MDIEVITTPFGRPAFQALRRAVDRAKAAEALAPVTVVVPTNVLGVAVRRDLARASGPSGRVGVAGIEVLTVYRLGELLGGPPLAASGRRPVSTPLVTAAARAALRSEPRGFAAVAGHAATEQAFVRAHRELSELDDQALERLSRRSRRARDVVYLHRRIASHLSSSWYGEQDLFAAATEAMVAGERLTSRLVAERGAVVMHLPERLTRSAATMLVALAETGKPVSVIAPVTGVDDADQATRTVLGRLGLGRPARAEPPEATVPAEPSPVRLRSTSDPQEEVRAAVRDVVDAARAGVPLDRMALVYGPRDPYARIVHEQLQAAGIERNGAGVTTLAGTVAGRLAAALAGLSAGPFGREAITALFSTAPLHRPAPPHGPVPVARWERLTHQAGVVEGIDEWDRRLARLAADLGETALRARADGHEDRSRALRQDSDAAGTLRRFVLDLHHRLRPRTGERSWADHATTLVRLLDDLTGGRDARVAWPEAEQAAFHDVEATLDRVAHVQTLEAGPVEAELFARNLVLELEETRARIGTIGRGVLVGPVGEACGLDLDLVVVLGLAEGSYPARRRDDPLLGEADRSAVGDDLLAGRRHRMGIEHRHLLAAVETVRGHGRAVLSYSRGDLRSAAERTPSRWFLVQASALAGEPVWDDDLSRSVPRYDSVPSWAAALRRTAFPATSSDFDVAELLRAVETGPEGGPGAALHRLLADAAFARSVEAIRARSTAAFTRFDGDLRAVIDPADLPTLHSATALETWVDCPHKYLMAHLLHVEVPEDPEEILELAPQRRGTLVHTILERFVQAAIDEGRGAPDEPWCEEDAATLARLAEAAMEELRDTGVTGQELLWERQRRRLLADLQLFARHDSEARLRHRRRPLATEVAFGMAGAPPLVLELRDGRRMALRGQIDRIDQDDEGRLWVIDYKTGRKPSVAERPSVDDPVCAGRALQLAVYAAAATAAHDTSAETAQACFWYVCEPKSGSTSRRHRRTAEIVEVAFDDRVRNALIDTLTRICAGVAGGVFPARPPKPSEWRTHASCPYCDPDDLGTAEVYSRWQRVRLDPALRSYVEMADREVLDEEEVSPS